MVPYNPSAYDTPDFSLISQRHLTMITSSPSSQTFLTHSATSRSFPSTSPVPSWRSSLDILINPNRKDSKTQCLSTPSQAKSLHPFSSSATPPSTRYSFSQLHYQAVNRRAMPQHSLPPAMRSSCYAQQVWGRDRNPSGLA